MIQFNFEQALSDRQAEQSKQRDAEWRRYVLQMEATETAPDPDAVIAKLEQVGRSSADLDAAISRLRRRRHLVRLVAGVEQHRIDYQKHRKELETERQRFKPILDAHQQLIVRLSNLASSAQSDERSAGAADQELRETCSPEVLDAIQAGKRQLAELDERIRQNGYEIERIVSEVARLACESDHLLESDERRQLAADERRQKSEDLQAKAERLKQANDELSAQRPALLESLETLRVESLAAESF